MLVAFEGIDGSGKSTVIQRVAKELRRQGHAVKVTQEPTTTWLGKTVRRGISAKMDPLALAFLFLSDRAEHVRAMPGDKETIVLTDRYRDSTTAYQAAALSETIPNALPWLSSLQDGLFPRPDLALLLDVPAEVGVARLAGRSKKEPFEKVRFLRRVRSNYLKLAGEDRLIVVDASKPVDQVAAAATRLVLASLRRAKAS